MTKNTIQPAETGVQSVIPTHLVEVRLTEDERMFLFELLGEYLLLLSRASSVLGFPDLVDRIQVVSDLMDKCRDSDVLYSSAEFFETYVALEGAADLLEQPADETAPLCNSIRDKLVAVESGSFVAEPVEFEPAPANLAPTEAFESPRFEVKPHCDGWVVVGYWADGEEAFRGYFPEYDEALEAGEAFLSTAGKWWSDSAEPVIPKPSSPSRREFRMMDEYDRRELLERQRAYIAQQSRLLISDTAFAAIMLRDQISQIQRLIDAVDILEQTKRDYKRDGDILYQERLVLVRERIDPIVSSCSFEEYRSDIMRSVRAVLQYIGRILSGDISEQDIHGYIDAYMDAFSSDIHSAINIAMNSLGRSNYF